MQDSTSDASHRLSRDLLRRAGPGPARQRVIVIGVVVDTGAIGDIPCRKAGFRHLPCPPGGIPLPDVNVAIRARSAAVPATSGSSR